LQYDTVPEHVPPTQAPEQQSVLVPHGLPEPRHPVVTAVHLPPEQRPLQHCVFAVHEAAVGESGRHAVAAQILFGPQLPEQQSEPTWQEMPLVAHGPVRVPQTFGWLEPQTPPPGQGPEPTPHVRRPPQPSGTKPQFRPAHAVA
jgi:hypothetical protein